MVKNVGKVDRVVRIVVGLVMCFLAFTPSVDGGMEIAFYVIGGYLLITAIVGSCLIFRALDIDSHQHGGEYHSGPTE